MINNTGVGGTERRFGRLFARIADADPESVFIINAGLWKALVEARVVSGREARVRQLAEPLQRIAERAGLGWGTLGFWLRKLDYLLFATLLLARYGLAPRCLFHLVLGGAYVALPLMLLRPDHRTVVSVVSADLALTVGAPWALPLYRHALSRCAVVDALSEGAHADLTQRGIAGEKILVSPGSLLDVKRFQPAPEKYPWVVFAGRLVAEKNPLLFVEAIPAILGAFPLPGSSSSETDRSGRRSNRRWIGLASAVRSRRASARTLRRCLRRPVSSCRCSERIITLHRACLRPWRAVRCRSRRMSG